VNITNSLICASGTESATFASSTGGFKLQNVSGSGLNEAAYWADADDAWITTVAIGTGCGTGSPITGDQNNFHLVCGTTAAASFTITWPRTRLAAAQCSVTPYTSGVGTPTITTNNTTTLTVGFISTASTAWDVRCTGK
jgi:hypothetical protein